METDKKDYSYLRDELDKKAPADEVSSGGYDANLEEKEERVSWYDKGKKSYAEGRYEDAIIYSDRILEKYPEFVQALNMKKKSLMRLKRFDEAARYHIRLSEIHEKKRQKRGGKNKYAHSGSAAPISKKKKYFRGGIKKIKKKFSFLKNIGKKKKNKKENIYLSENMRDEEHPALILENIQEKEPKFQTSIEKYEILKDYLFEKKVEVEIDEENNLVSWKTSRDEQAKYKEILDGAEISEEKIYAEENICAHGEIGESADINSEKSEKIPYEGYFSNWYIQLCKYFKTYPLDYSSKDMLACKHMQEALKFEEKGGNHLLLSKANYLVALHLTPEDDLLFYNIKQFRKIFKEEKSKILPKFQTSIEKYKILKEYLTAKKIEVEIDEENNLVSWNTTRDEQEKYKEILDGSEENAYIEEMKEIEELGRELESIEIGDGKEERVEKEKIYAPGAPPLRRVRTSKGTAALISEEEIIELKPVDEEEEIYAQEELVEPISEEKYAAPLKSEKPPITENMCEADLPRSYNDAPTLEIEDGVKYLLLQKHYFQDKKNNLHLIPTEIIDHSLRLKYLPKEELPFEELLNKFREAGMKDIKKCAKRHKKIAKGFILLDEAKEAEPHLNLARHFVDCEKHCKKFTKKVGSTLAPVESVNYNDILKKFMNN